ncbi:MAG: cytochrome b [Rhodospirillaceae bacterium]|nr:cytochrome b [Rhodospirillaceae bacterium]MBT5242397.1 cytochrome b [Rhodospirillaceae bacterium]MBT5567338.1 cytochrome b [Rhodospirillaceae bacterium]MBT6091153.1 cytochrome b [Rhodospirillaceae bacterium]
MAAHNTNQLWGSVTKALHWSIALLIICNIVIAQWISTLEVDVLGDPEMWQFLTPLHKSIGMIALILIVIRLVWAFCGTRPELPSDTPQWQRNLTFSVHGLIYMLILLVPVAGYSASASVGSRFELFWLFVVPNVVPKNETISTVTYWIHFVGGWALAGMVALHAASALWHHFFEKDDILTRMLPRLGSDKSTSANPAE